VGVQEDRLKELFSRALGGDGAAYHAFLESLSGLLRAFLGRRLARLPDEVEDLVQETLLAVHNQRHTYDPTLPVTAWVHAIARYKLIDFLRRRAGHEALHDPIGDDDEFMAASDDEPREARRDLATLLGQLPDRHRLPILYV
jgi:RNA polymerase sigma-70 factor (ECF subfamily)